MQATDPYNPFRLVSCLLCGKESMVCHMTLCELKPGALASLGRPDINYLHPACLTKLKSHLTQETPPCPTPPT